LGGFSAPKRKSTLDDPGGGLGKKKSWPHSATAGPGKTSRGSATSRCSRLPILGAKGREGGGTKKKGWVEKLTEKWAGRRGSSAQRQGYSFYTRTGKVKNPRPSGSKQQEGEKKREEKSDFVLCHQGEKVPMAADCDRYEAKSTVFYLRTNWSTVLPYRTGKQIRGEGNTMYSAPDNVEVIGNTS